MLDADIKTKLLIILPVVFVVILVMLAVNIRFKDSLSRTEHQILDFAYKELRITEKNNAVPVNILESPIDFGHVTAEYGMTQPSDTASGEEQLDVSLIVVGENSKMAIIKGILVKEGDVIDNKRVVKIEPDKVLLKNKTDQWIKVTK